MSQDLKELISKYQGKEAYNPDEATTKFLMDTYSDFLLTRNLKEEPQPLLGGKTLHEFWDRCNYDYNVLVDDDDEDDPVRSYASTISRDKSNAFISNLTLQLLYPSVIAQNSQQEIDRTISQVSRSMLEWAHNNDGRPSMSGHQKSIMYTHKQVVEGTVHVMDNIIDGRLESQLVPNDEIFIPNFFQPDIQKQPYIFRAQSEITYGEVLDLYGGLPNFKYVIPNAVHEWVQQSGDEFAKEFTGLIEDERCHVVWVWKDIPRQLFKNFGVKKGAKKAKLFNIIINGVLMFKPDNLMPYHDGYYPINKGIFEMFSDPRYYWGNSMPGKAREDKRWLDGWKTLIRYKAKLAAIPPIVTFNGKFVDSDFYIPGTSTAAPTDMKPGDVQAMPGVTGGVTASDIMIMDRAEREVEMGNISPQGQGAEGNRQQTRAEVLVREENTQKIMTSFSQQVAFLVEARTFPILKRLYQFLPKSTMKKLVVPDQVLPDGEYGNMEIIFKKLPDMTDEQRELESFKIRGEQMAAKKRGNTKSINYINPEYLNEIDLYITAVADPKPRATSSYRRAEAREKYEFYASDPEMFNKKAAARSVIRSFGDNESEMLNEQQPVVNPAGINNINKKTPSEALSPAGAGTKGLPELNM